MHKLGLWAKQVPEAMPGDLDLQIAALLGALTDDLSVWDTLATRYRTDMFIGLFLNGSNEGTTLATATLKLLADRHLEIGFDIYSGTDDGD